MTQFAAGVLLVLALVFAWLTPYVTNARGERATRRTQIITAWIAVVLAFTAGALV